MEGVEDVSMELELNEFLLEHVLQCRSPSASTPQHLPLNPSAPFPPRRAGVAAPIGGERDGGGRPGWGRRRKRAVRRWSRPWRPEASPQVAGVGAGLSLLALCICSARASGLPWRLTPTGCRGAAFPMNGKDRTLTCSSSVQAGSRARVCDLEVPRGGIERGGGGGSGEVVDGAGSRRS